MKNRMLFILPAVLWFVCAAAGQEVLTNQSVVEMVTAGLPDEIIVAKIKGSRTNFDLSTPALTQLTQAKVSAAVIKIMLEPRPGDPAPTAALTTTANATNPDDPTAPHDPGIYLVSVNRDGVRKLILIDRAGSGHEKTANIWGHAFSYGIAKAKIKAELPGPRATTRTASQKPDFYMYFPPTGNLGAADTISSPSQFALISLEAKKDHRETAVEKVGFANASAGTDEKRTFRFNAEKIRPYAYKITPDASLKNGEYAFIAGTSMGGTASSGSVVIFDFGVDVN